MQKPEILILGAGAVGAFHGGVLAGQGAAVSVVVRSHRDEVSAGGFEIRSPLGDSVFRPRTILAPGESPRAFPDYLLVSLKLTADANPVALMRPLVSPETTIVLLQNGVEIEEPIAAAFPENEILSGVAYIGVTRTGPRQIEHTAGGRVILGAYPHGLSDSAERLGELMEKGGIDCRRTPEIQSARWQKCAWNMLNPISVLTGCAGTLTLLRDPEGRNVVRKAMEEVRAVASAVGHPFPPETVERFIRGTLELPDIRTSMAQDFLAGRPLELEAILGNVLRAAERSDTEVPVLRTIYGLARILEGGRSTG